MGATKGKAQYRHVDHNKRRQPTSSHGGLGKLRTEVVRYIKIGYCGIRSLLVVIFVVVLST